MGDVVAFVNLRISMRSTQGVPEFGVRNSESELMCEVQGSMCEVQSQSRKAPLRTRESGKRGNGA
jgi:hypothetical protein